MVESFNQIKKIKESALIPLEEIIAIDLNLSGIAVDLPYSRVRFYLQINGCSLPFSVEYNKDSLYCIHGDKLYLDNVHLCDVDKLLEDTCEVFYTRKNGKVLCFNPNNRSSCSGCQFCYQPKSNDKRQVAVNMLLDAFKQWLEQNNFVDLSHLEQIAVVTGCFKNEQIVVSYLLRLREVLHMLGFRKEILYFGIISNIQSIELLSQIKPLQLCFTIECFENREKILLPSKNLELDHLKALMKESINLGITTTFSYILGLDSLSSMNKEMLLLKDYVTAFPIISLFQANHNRSQHRNKEANNILYYLNARKQIENIFANTGLKPNSWNNYRSLWRTCYGETNDDIILNL